ncbi:hypothetical protein SEMRO_838_G209210.1 [Seminavis robusta]|uniref:Uncharacterized protein n=1 Tax=Seminavis robusta TaxID=568900 RepID=A0A9N8HJ70_9STRA|nr:hypothetical protein SEMRO_838_G209210.1 [Seminavis robusta]|eukprot:Sro838_g209210.1 n/a (507) ;mRNA; f:37536-39056
MSNEPTAILDSTTDNAHGIPHVIADHFPEGRVENARVFECGKCNTAQSYCRKVIEAFIHENQGTCLQFECRVSGCKGRTWFVCVDCCRKCGDSIANAEHHLSASKIHKKNRKALGHAIEEEASVDLITAAANASNSGDPENPNLMESCSVGAQSWGQDDTSLDHHQSSSPGKRNYESAFGSSHFHPIAQAAVGEESALNHVDATHTNQTLPVSMDLSLFGDQPAESITWITNLHQRKKKATPTELSLALGADSNMAYFFAEEEHGSPDGKIGGGLRALVGRAFQGTWALSQSSLPTFPEAVFQAQFMVQYVSMNEVQWQRQIDILDALRRSSNDSSLLQSTHLLSSKKDLRRVFDDGNQNSLWNTLPIPPVHNIGNIGYVSPKDLLTFAFAFGFKLDPIYVLNSTLEAELDAAQNLPAYHVSDCREVQEMKRGTIKFIRNSDEEFDVVLVVPCSDWRDGHGISHVKNNRSSVTTWSWSILPPKDNVNSTDNTLPIAVGAKKERVLG